VPSFLTMGSQILSFIQAGAPLGLSTCTLSPVNMCSFFVPRSRSLMSVWPRLAAFRAAWRGDLPAKTPISLPFSSQGEVSHLFLCHDISLRESLDSHCTLK